jgi:hypothetical protein
MKHKKRNNRVLAHPIYNKDKGRYALLFLLPLMVSMVGASSATANAGNGGVPKVVVNILIDQLRSDYLSAFMPLYGEGGFKKMMAEGSIYTQGEYPHAHVDQANAAATLASGTVPSRHGVVADRWLDRKTLRPAFCVTDRQYSGLGGGQNGMSPMHLLVSTIGDELKVATGGKSLVYAIAPDPQAAIFSAGHAADAAIWIDNATGLWSSSSYYSAFPTWATAYNQYYSLPERLNNIVWEPCSDLVGNFNYFLSGEMQRPFKHGFKGDSRYVDFKTSALVNEEVTNIAIACVEKSSLGTDGITDYLSLAYYAGNFKHLSLNEVSIETQDNYVRLDRSLEKLIKSIEQKVGAGNALYVLTSTGYVDEENAELSKYRIPTGVFDVKRASSLLNMYLVAIYGQGEYVEATYGTQIYLNQKLIEERQINLSELLLRAQDLLLQMSGVKDVYTSARLIGGAWTPEISKIRGGFAPHLSGDILIEVSPGWTYYNADTNQRQMVRDSYVPFPIIFYGKGVSAATYNMPTTVDYIAPTLSRAMRIRAPNACSLRPLF